MTSLTYARTRLFLGISNVGFWVLISAWLLWKPLDLSILTLALIRVLGSLPFDLLGGFFLPERFGRLPGGETFPSFLGRWTRGVLLQGLLISLFLFFVQKILSLPGKLILFIGLQGILLFFQQFIAQLLAGIRTASITRSEREALHAHPFLKDRPIPKLTFLRSNDAGFVGGWSGNSLVLPDSWRTELSPDTLAIQVLRRSFVQSSGARTRGVALAILFNTVGFALALTYPNLTLTKLVALSTLWSFLGVLVLPTLSRPTVFAADRFALDSGVPPEALKAAIAELDRLQDDEPERPALVEAIFHPIPSALSRIRALESGKKVRVVGGWQLLRTALYLSWASGSFLSRAVHCNIGRPDLWVYFPGD